jgi:DNA-3-methyladenine glycosylase
MDLMISYRKTGSNKTAKKNISLKNLTSGPSKLCQAMNIKKNTFDQVNIITSDEIWLQEIMNPDKNTQENEFQIIKAKRIGIENAGEEAKNKLFRFYIKNNNFVSIKEKEEIELDI